MKKLFFAITLFFVLLLSNISCAQGIRIDQVRGLPDTLKYILDAITDPADIDTLFKYVTYPDANTIAFLDADSNVVATISLDEETLEISGGLLTVIGGVGANLNYITEDTTANKVIVSSDSTRFDGDLDVDGNLTLGGGLSIDDYLAVNANASEGQSWFNITFDDSSDFASAPPSYGHALSGVASITHTDIDAQTGSIYNHITGFLGESVVNVSGTGGFADVFQIVGTTGAIYLKDTNNDTIPKAFGVLSRLLANQTGTNIGNFYGYATQGDYYFPVTVDTVFHFYSNGSEFNSNHIVGQQYHFYGEGDYPSYFGGPIIVGEITYPDSDGTAGQVMKTDGSGNMYWEADATGGAPTWGLISGNIALQTDLTSYLSSNYLQANENITLSGDVSGTGTTNIAVTVTDYSHNHIITNIENLRDTLNSIWGAILARQILIPNLSDTSKYLEKSDSSIFATQTDIVDFITGNESITISGDASGTGTTSISITLGEDVAGVNEVDVPALEDTLETILDLQDLQGNLGPAHLNSGTSASSSTFWRGDGTWATPPGSDPDSSIFATQTDLREAAIDPVGQYDFVMADTDTTWDVIESSDTPANGEVPTWDNGTLTWQPQGADSSIFATQTDLAEAAIDPVGQYDLVMADTDTTWDVLESTNSPSNDDVAVWDNGSITWQPEAGTVTQLDDVGDVDTYSSPAAGELLEYDGDSWVHQTKDELDLLEKVDSNLYATQYDLTQVTGAITQAQLDKLEMMWVYLELDTTDALNPSGFTAETDITPSALTTSEVLNVVGMDNDVVRCKVDSGQYRVYANNTWEGWTGSEAFYKDVDSVQLRHYASASNGTETLQTFYIADDSDAWSVTTVSTGSALPVIESYTQFTITSPDDYDTLGCALPAADVGDVLVALMGCDHSTAGDPFETQYGWTEIAKGGGTTPDSYVKAVYRVVDGTEADSIWFGVYQFAGIWVNVVRISGANTSNPINDFNSITQVETNTQLAIPEVTTDVNNCLAFYLMTTDGDQGTESVAGTGWSEENEIDVGSDTRGSWGTKDQLTAGGTGTATVSWSSSEGAVGFQFAVEPAP